MTRCGRALVLAAGLAVPAGLAAQNPPAPPAPAPARPPAGVPARADTLARRDSLQRPDSAARAPRPGAGQDSLPLPDSLSPDSFSSVLPPLGQPAGPMPVGGRLVFDRDALVFSGALTLGEMLAQVPGVFLQRVSWFGLPEVVHYAGQGANSVELFWDGYALDPMGEDSAGVDLSRIPLDLLRRVEVEVRPTVLRVYLVSDTQPVRRPRTETSFATGDAQTNSYRIRYLNRWRGGAGLGLGVNWFGTNGAATAPAASSDLTLWAKATWALSTRLGVDAQAMRYSLRRDPLTVLPGRKVHRSDVIVRAFASSRDEGMGWRLDALLGASAYGDSGATDGPRIAQGAAFAGYRSERWSAEVGARVRDARIPLEVAARAAATPLRLVTIDAFAIRRTLLGDRSSSELGVGVSVRPLGPILLRGSLRRRDAVPVPAVLADTAQRVTDWSAGAGLLARRVELEVGLERHGWYAAPAYGVFAEQIAAGTSLPVRTVSGRFAIRPKRYLTLSGWYRHPLDAVTAGFEPPHHTRVAATFRSQFLPRFRRGALDVVVQLAAEGWSDGVMGTDAGGGPVVLEGHGTLDWLVEFRLLGAVVYWTFRNSQLERYELLPGVKMARSLQRYGVRWEFSN